MHFAIDNKCSLFTQREYIDCMTHKKNPNLLIKINTLKKSSVSNDVGAFGHQKSN